MKKEKQYPKDTRTEIPVTTHNWGPSLVRMQIDEGLRMILMDEWKKNRKNKELDYRKNLAGQLDHETGYPTESRKRILPYLGKYFHIYDQAQARFFQREPQKPDYVLSALWINNQKKHEFNPPHDHDGTLSFVIYLQVPEVLRIENQASKGKSCGPGGIQFVYGDGVRDAINFVSHFPIELDMFIFPAWLKHWVSPFKSDCTRISVSGNVYDVKIGKALAGSKRIEIKT